MPLRVDRLPRRRKLGIATPNWRSGIFWDLGRAGNDALVDDLYVVQRPPGFSPKEHLEELRTMQLEEDRRKHELSLAQLRSESDEQAKNIAESLHQVTVETAKFTTKWTYIAVALAGAALLVVLATYVFPDFGRHLGDVILGSHPTSTPTP